MAVQLRLAGRHWAGTLLAQGDHRILLDFFILALVLFLATTVYTVAGFGNALLAMPVMIPMLGIQTAAPTMGILSTVTFAINLFKFRRSFSLRLMWRVAVGAALTIPVGVWLIDAVPEEWLRMALGLICVGYGVYRLLQFAPPALKHPFWAFSLGSIGGIFGGAFNTAGPLVVIYAETQAWPPENFRTNLAGFFVISSIINIGAHLLTGHMTVAVMENSLAGIPGALLGLWLGWYLQQFVDQKKFRVLVSLMLVLIGIRLILSIWF
ncbi:MAG: sulfite exporter TauE/SafE family protein [Anaerolineales bacterium]|nr:sulfite exporter TauE/SafE family protein [Anaerolineales bacterium]